MFYKIEYLTDHSKETGHLDHSEVLEVTTGLQALREAQATALVQHERVICTPCDESGNVDCAADYIATRKGTGWLLE